MKRKNTETISKTHKRRFGDWSEHEYLVTTFGCLYLGCFLSVSLFLGYFWFLGADFVNPVTRIEYVLETEFSAEVQVLEAEYNRYGWDDEVDTFSISLVMPPSIAESFILQQCNSDLETLPTMYLSHPTYEYVVDGQHSCGIGFWVVFSIDSSNNELYHIDIYGEPECYSKNPFSAVLPYRK
jgi:hypothetical protein